MKSAEAFFFPSTNARTDLFISCNGTSTVARIITTIVVASRDTTIKECFTIFLEFVVTKGCHGELKVLIGTTFVGAKDLIHKNEATSFVHNLFLRSMNKPFASDGWRGRRFGLLVLEMASSWSGVWKGSSEEGERLVRQNAQSSDDELPFKINEKVESLAEKV